MPESYYDVPGAGNGTVLRGKMMSWLAASGGAKRFCNKKISKAPNRTSLAERSIHAESQTSKVALGNSTNIPVKTRDGKLYPKKNFVVRRLDDVSRKLRSIPPYQHLLTNQLGMELIDRSSFGCFGQCDVEVWFRREAVGLAQPSQWDLRLDQQDTNFRQYYRTDFW